MSISEPQPSSSASSSIVQQQQTIRTVENERITLPSQNTKENDDALSDSSNDVENLAMRTLENLDEKV
ncbi:unnamed protein product [Dracunculus medinensis]|uniref:Uncharacterized protein n=1 Tax=Dracunculus medinensis TaxID=318479 RepID=A0A0N4UCK3_DRAME|nr:unnamed protein product [Dracunculus medinensis]